MNQTAVNPDGAEVHPAETWQDRLRAKLSACNYLMVDLVPRFAMAHRVGAPDIGDLLIIKKEDGSGIELAVTLSQRRDTEILFTIVKDLNDDGAQKFDTGSTIRLSADDIYNTRWTVHPAKVVCLDGLEDE